MEECANCPRAARCVMGQGPRPSPVMLIGEAPGEDEDRIGQPFVGKSGTELTQTYLPLAGLSRTNVYVTNMVKCRPTNNRQPTEEESSVCSQHWLPVELAECQPEVVLLLGATACRLLGDDFDLETEHGIPRRAVLFGTEVWAVPMYHPASGLHDTGMMTPMLEDWAALKPWLADDVWMWAEEDNSVRDYQLIRNLDDLRRYFMECGNEEAEVKLCGFDTESHGGVPWSVQISLKQGTGRLILLGGKRKLLWELAHLLKMYTIVYHHAIADLEIAGLVGVAGLPLRDTMQEAYGFQNLRQGLKPLSRRLLGRKRKSWYEVVRPPSLDVLEVWLLRARNYVEENYTVLEERVSEKTGKPLKPKVRKSKLQGTLESILNHTRDSSEYDPWVKLRERVVEEELKHLEEQLGPVPVMGIAHCRLEDAVAYGCSDADDTLTLAQKFEWRRAHTLPEIVKADVDACSEVQEQVYGRTGADGHEVVQAGSDAGG